MKLIRCVTVLIILGVFLVCLPSFGTQAALDGTAPQNHLPSTRAAVVPFDFAVAADMRLYTGSGIYNSPAYFLGATQALAEAGDFAFLISPGDLDPIVDARWTITSSLGAALPWVPVAGNHELPGGGVEAQFGANMEWLRTWPVGGGAFVANPGPAACPTTTYSFDYLSAHFAVLNEYCDGSSDTNPDANIPDLLYNWLAADLAATTQPILFVIGHEPAYPMPDMENGRIRHLGDSLDQFPSERDRFWDLLRSEGVLAYICGHTHNFSAVQIQGVWQVDAGHARGKGDPDAHSTVLLFHIQPDWVKLDVLREISSGGPYALKYAFYLSGGARSYLPLVSQSAQP